MRQLFVGLLLAAVVCSGTSSIRGLLQSSGGADLGSSCQRQRPLGPRGKISSPGYPVSYPNHTSCSWFIVGRRNQVITISFDDLDLGGLEECEKSPCCEGTWIKMGPTPSGGERVHCGCKVPEPFLSRSSKVWIKFHSSPTQVPRGRGFQLSYTVGESLCSESSHRLPTAGDRFLNVTSSLSAAYQAHRQARKEGKGRQHLQDCRTAPYEDPNPHQGLSFRPKGSGLWHKFHVTTPLVGFLNFLSGGVELRGMRTDRVPIAPLYFLFPFCPSPVPSATFCGTLSTFAEASHTDGSA